MFFVARERFGNTHVMVSALGSFHTLQIRRPKSVCLDCSLPGGFTVLKWFPLKGTSDLIFPIAKLNIPEHLASQEFSEDFIKVVLENISEKNISVVPTSPPIAKFIKRNRRYKKMLPVGIRI